MGYMAKKTLKKRIFWGVVSAVSSYLISKVISKVFSKKKKK